MATNSVHGKSGDVLIGGVALGVREWSATIQKDEHDVTNKQSGGWQDMVLGIARLEGSLTAIWDRDIPSSGTPPYSLVSAQAGVSFTLEIGDPSATAGESKLTFTGIIQSLEITSAHDGVIEYSVSFKSTGTVTHTINS